MYAIKEIISFCICMIAIPFSSRGSILMYHSVGHNDKFSTVTPETFERQLTFLRKRGYTVLPLEEMIKRIQNKESLSRCIALTFDDGYEDFYFTVFPLLERYKMHASLFVTTGYIGGVMTTKQGQKFNIVSEAQMREMAHTPWVSLYSHTETHPKLSDIPIDSAIAEMETSRTRIESITQKKAPVFAYPFGNTSEAIIAYLRSAPQWLAGVIVRPGLVSESPDLLLLPRNSVDSSVGIWQFRMKLTDGIVWFNTLKTWLKF